MVDGGSLSYNGSLTLSLNRTNFDCSDTQNPVTLILSGVDERGLRDSLAFEITVADTTKPILTTPAAQSLCYSSGSAYTIPELAATDNCSSVNVTYEISGATSRSGTGTNASGIFNPGESLVKWIVKDASGNTSMSSTLVSVNTALLASIADVYAIGPNATAKNTIYRGYSSSLTIQPTVSGGSGSYAFQWSSGESTPAITVMAAGTYTVTITDSRGCLTTASIAINLEDVACGNKNNKVLVCHKGKMLCISSADVADHVAHGDKLGSCTTSSIVALANTPEEEISLKSSEIKVYPIPASTYVVISGLDSKNCDYRLFNLNGQTISKGVLQQEKINLPNGLANGFYILQLLQNGRTIHTQRIVVDHN